MRRIVEISGDGYHICVKNNNFSALKDGVETSHIHFSDINCIILHGNSITYSNAAIQKCLENKIPIVFCAKNHLPAGMLLPYYANIEYGKRLEIQTNVSLPLKKQVWKQIISAKLNNQAACLSKFYDENKYRRILHFAKTVKTGDSTFREAAGARIYFSLLFENFNRSKDNEDIINAALNYGYIILRSGVARAVVSSGLNPSIAVFHSKNQNSFCLIDDLIEPLRPMIDYIVKSNYSDFIKEKTLNPLLKKLLVSVSEQNLFFKDGAYAFIAGLQKYIQSYLSYISKESDIIDFPRIFDDFKV